MNRPLGISVVMVSFLAASAWAALTKDKDYEAGKFALEVGGTSAGFVQSVEGGHATADGVQQKIAGPRPIAPPSGPIAVPYPNQAAVKKAFGQPILTDAKVDAYFNPGELKVDKQAPWSKHKNSEGGAPALEFTAAEPKTFSVELQNDLYESGKTPSPNTKYTMFLPEATPTRATANLKMIEPSKTMNKTEGKRHAAPSEESKNESESSSENSNSGDDGKP